MIDDINEIRALATKYSVEQLRNLADLKLLDPIKAVMAGNMINHIQKQNAKPPSTSVAQDLLGIQGSGTGTMAGTTLGMQGQEQGPTAPPQQPPQQPPQMAQAPAGIEGLPAGEVGNYAGGGIVAFDDGGYVPKYAGGTDGSLINTDPQRVAGRGFVAPSTDVLQQALQQVEAALAASPPGRGRSALENRRNELRSRLGVSGSPVATTAPAVDQSAAETARLQRQNDRNPFATDNNLPLPAPPKARVDERIPQLKTSSVSELPALSSTLTPPPTSITPLKQDVPAARELEDIHQESLAAYKTRGINPDLYKDLVTKEEGKQTELDKRKERAGGEALMEFGLGWLGAKRGEEAKKAGESGKSALNSYKQSIKEVRTDEEKLADRVNSFKLADQQARMTGLKEDSAIREKEKDRVVNAEGKYIESLNAAQTKEAELATHQYGYQSAAESSKFNTIVSAQTQRDIARLSAETQRWVSSRPPAEILAIEEVAKRTGKPFEQAMKDFYGARAGARNMYTREEAMKDARKNLENQGIINPTDAQMQAEINKQMRIYGGDNGGGGGSLQQGANGSFNYVPRQ